MREPSNNLPTLEDALDSPVEGTDSITIPVLNEIINSQELENELLENLQLPDALRQQLASRITHLVQQKLSSLLPEIMQEIEQELSQTIQRHIATQLPEILNDALKNPTK